MTVLLAMPKLYFARRLAVTCDKPLFSNRRTDLTDAIFLNRIRFYSANVFDGLMLPSTVARAFVVLLLQVFIMTVATALALENFGVVAIVT